MLVTVAPRTRLATELIEERVKDEIREALDSLFRQGFIVDVNVQMHNGREAAYRITHVHQVIDLPEED